MIDADRLTKQFGRVTAVDSLSFSVPRGTVVGFLGPNGAGKTTTIRMICGYLAPTTGTVRVDGFSVQSDSLEVRRRIGYMPEATPLYPEMRVEEYLRFRSRIFGMRRRSATGAIAGVVRRCWLEPVRRRPIGQLSKGYRQRVGLAAALLHNPPVLILDEPTAGLDPTQIREVRSLIRELAGTHTILLSTHILPEVEFTCDRLLLIAGGRLRAEGAIGELRNRAARTARYMIETKANDLGPRLRELPSILRVEEQELPDRWRRMILTAKPDAPDQREAIARMLQQSSAPFRELQRIGATLEQLFLEVVTQAEAGEQRRVSHGTSILDGGAVAAAPAHDRSESDHHHEAAQDHSESDHHQSDLHEHEEARP